MSGHADDPSRPSFAINDPSVVKEVEAEFAAYYRALAANDVAALNRFFFDSPVTIRYGNAEVLYGHAEIKAYRSTVTAPTAPKPSARPTSKTPLSPIASRAAWTRATARSIS